MDDTLMPLVEFLRARLLEDERSASDASPDGGREHAARELAEVEAKRRILNNYIDGVDHSSGTLRIIAAVYANHPHYDEAWQA